VRRAGGAVILAVLVRRSGTGPFLDGVRTIGPWSLLAALGITSVTTACSGWRWSVVARGLGVELPLRAAIVAYYRSQFVNSALPGGIVGDVHRGLRHGREAGDVGRGLRAVAWERTAGQVVQAGLAAAVLLGLASPVRPVMPRVLLAAVLAAVCAALVVHLLPHRRPSRRARIVRAARGDVRDGLLARRAWPAVTAASVIVVAGHTGIFLIAAETAGTSASPVQLWPLATLALLAMAVPFGVGGWGPREGVAAWAFGAAGLGAGQGLATASAYGVLALVATLPGAVVLAVEWLRRGRTEESDARSVDEEPRRPAFAGVPAPGGADG
jgi:uncharacterized membrane protein YbhN (UPF0104 family)